MTIREMREKMGMSQSEFANKFKISTRTLQSWEHGHRVPPPHVIYMLERILYLEEKIKAYKKEI